MAVGRATLRGVRLGQGGRPQLAFLHAAIADHRSWSGLLRLLAPDMDVVAYDQRGFGATTYEAEGHDQVVDLLAVLDACDLRAARARRQLTRRADRVGLHPDPPRAGGRAGAAGPRRLGGTKGGRVSPAARGGSLLAGTRGGRGGRGPRRAQPGRDPVVARRARRARGPGDRCGAPTRPRHERRCAVGRQSGSRAARRRRLVAGGRDRLPRSRARGRPRHEPPAGPLSRPGPTDPRRASCA